MADSPTVETLRASALHRGFKLVRSRRRKPGGDFGLYGLTDAAGAPLLGFGPGGLTATGDEVAAYLRTGTNALWRESADATPEPAPRAKRATTPEAEDADGAAPVRTRRASGRSRARVAEPEPAPAPTPAPAPRPAARTRAPPRPAPEPETVVRPADKRDATALAALLTRGSDGTIEPKTVRERLERVLATGGVIVADRAGAIGCVAWSMVPALQHDPLARITMLLVDDRSRRAGIGRSLVEALATTLGDGVAIEAMSDITIGAAHGFFRRLGFVQTSYRFTRPPPE